MFWNIFSDAFILPDNSSDFRWKEEKFIALF